MTGTKRFTVAELHPCRRRELGRARPVVHAATGEGRLACGRLVVDKVFARPETPVTCRRCRALLEEKVEAPW